MAPDPQRLAAVPGRPSPKRLGKLPIYIGVGVVTVVGLVPLGFVMREIIRDAQVSSATRLDAGPASPGDAIAAEATGFTAAEGPPFIEAAASTPGMATLSSPTASSVRNSSDRPSRTACSASVRMRPMAARSRSGPPPHAASRVAADQARSEAPRPGRLPHKAKNRT